MGNFTGILSDIENIIGTAATLQLVRERGGTKINIPKNPTEKCQIVQIIGLKLAEKLSLEFGFGEIILPMGHFRGREHKKILAAQMIEQGLTNNTIAAKLEIHERTVRRVKEKNYLSLPLIDYIEEKERKEHEKTIHNKS